MNHTPMSPSKQSGGFHSTRWSLVARAAENDIARTPDAVAETGEALETLCRIYWTPLFVFVRRRGYSPEEAEDLVQGFLANALEKNVFAVADPEKGRLRSFLLTALKRYLVDQRRAEVALKRGGGGHLVSIDARVGERSGGWQIADQSSTPEAAYQHRWVCSLLEQCVSRLGSEYVEQGKGALFESLLPLLTPGTGATAAEAAAALGSSPGAIRVALSRMRKRFGQIFMQEVEATLLPGENVEEEVRCLLALVSTDKSYF